MPDQTNFTQSIAVGRGLRQLTKDSGGYSPTDQGTNNVMIGPDAGQALTTGYYNTIVGGSAGLYLTGIGTVATYVPDTPIGNVGNTAIGFAAGAGLNGGLDNTFIGTNCGLNAYTGMDNVGAGVKALERIEAGSENAAVVHGGMQYVVGVGGLVAGSFVAFRTGSTGHRLAAFGDQAGRFLNGEEGNRSAKTGGLYSLYVGPRTTSASNTAVNEVAIGCGTEGRGSNTFAFGNADVSDYYFNGGHLRIEGSGKGLKVAGNQVVGARGAAVADATDAASTTARLNDLLARLRTHGLIAS